MSSASGFTAGSGNGHYSDSRSSGSGSSTISSILIPVYYGFRDHTSTSVKPSTPSSTSNRTHATCCDPTTSLTTTSGQ